ncbi:MAG: DNA-formamidopyrimidine glycosylase, partial [Hyphomicrobiales bacterium]|nr:DNA-formamidopyrimidine glycosylase [Hyphomicrobiales bacterium]
MPELPEVETVRRGLEPAMAGRRILRVEARRGGLRFPFPEDFAGRLDGRRVVALRRRAKYLLVDLDDGWTLIAHLGMSGSFRVETGAEAATPGRFHRPRHAGAAHDHVSIDLEGGVRVVYNDPRRFGFMDLARTAALGQAKHLAALGIEPLGEAFDASALAGALAGARTALKAAL